MKWYYVIACDNIKKHPMVCGNDNLDEYGYSEVDFIIGKKITNWNNNIIFQAKTPKHDGDPDDALQNKQMLPIFSNNLIDELNKINITAIQYLPIKVLRPDNTIVHGFSIANLLDIVGAFNFDKSSFDRFDLDFPNKNVRGKIAGVTKYVLNSDMLGGKNIIRLKEYNRAMFVSDIIRNIFKINKFTGYSFKEVELY